MNKKVGKRIFILLVIFCLCLAVVRFHESKMSYWIETTSIHPDYRCSRCGDYGVITMKYCPECGCKMSNYKPQKIELIWEMED